MRRAGSPRQGGSWCEATAAPRSPRRPTTLARDRDPSGRLSRGSNKTKLSNPGLSVCPGCRSELLNDVGTGPSAVLKTAEPVQ